MTERYGSGHGDEGRRPSGRGAVTERLARQSSEVREIDLTDEATARATEDDTDGAPAARDGDQADRESSGAFEPASPVTPTADPPAEATTAESSSIFDVDERDKREEEHPTGYEPPVADTDRSGEASDGSGEITPTPVPAADPPAGTPVPEGLPEPPSAAGSSTSRPGSWTSPARRSRRPAASSTTSSSRSPRPCASSAASSPAPRARPRTSAWPCGPTASSSSACWNWPAEPAPQHRGRGGVPARRPGDPRAAPGRRAGPAGGPARARGSGPARALPLHGRDQHPGLHHPGRGPRGPAPVPAGPGRGGRAGGPAGRRRRHPPLLTLGRPGGHPQD